MKKLSATLLLTVVGMLVGLSFAPSAQAYPEITFDASVSKTLVSPGETFTATSSANVQCEWSQEWDGTTNEDTGTALTTEFTAPDVDESTTIPVNFQCDYDADAGITKGSAAMTPATWTRSINVTVAPAGETSAGDDNGGGAANMPNTGGPNLLFLIAGLLLLLTGAVAVRMARGRDSGAAELTEPDPSRA